MLQTMLGIFEKQVKQACKNGNMKEVQKKDIQMQNESKYQ
jgi:hypothetical protein